MVIRLLNTASLKIVKFEGEEIPKYAILSHTWAAGQEITFQEMLECLKDARHPSRSKSGFKKIQSTCLKAQSHGLAYAWVDTCCIDKKDPTELGEAINSMFKWYQQASICYVHLEDLVGGIERLKDCRWLTRGWCLQELIAPKELKFYNRHWQMVGRKVELCEPLSQITGIDIEILRRQQSLDMIPVARRMSWAAGRETARAEDTAYCLLGVFDIHMPLLYGEGGVSAFIRLQEEIIKRSYDLTVFAPLSYPFAHDESRISRCDLFARSPQEFVGCRRVMRNPRTNYFGFAHPFNMTNTGLHIPIQQMRVLIDWGQPLYLLSLGCQGSRHPEDPLYLYLQKVAPSIFVPVKISSGLFARKLQTPSALPSEEEQIFIATKCARVSRLLAANPKQLVRFTVNGKPTLGFRTSNERTKLYWDISRSSLFVHYSTALVMKLDLYRLGRADWAYTYRYVYIYIGMTAVSEWNIFPKCIELRTTVVSQEMFDADLTVHMNESSGTFATLMLGPNLITATLSRIDGSNYMVDVNIRP